MQGLGKDLGAGVSPTQPQVKCLLNICALVVIRIVDLVGDETTLHTDARPMPMAQQDGVATSLSLIFKSVW